MGIFVRVILEVYQNLIELIGVATTSKGLVLSFLHLRSSNQLHRFCNLRGALNRFDTAADVTKVGHLSG